MKKVLLFFVALVAVMGIYYVDHYEKKKEIIEEFFSDIKDYTGEYIINSDRTLKDIDYSTDKIDTSVLYLRGEFTLSILDSTINKKGDSYNKYNGINSSIIIDKSNLIIDNTTILTRGLYANGIYNKGNILLKDSNINTAKDYSKVIINEEIIEINNSILSSDGVNSDIIDNNGVLNINNGTYNSKSGFLINNGVSNIKEANIDTKDGILNNGNLNLDSINMVNYKDYSIKSMGDSTININNSSITNNGDYLMELSYSDCVINMDNNTLINNSDYIIKSVNSNSIINLNNQSIDGNIYIDASSKMIINMKNSYLNSKILNNKELIISMDKDSTLILNNDLYLNGFNGLGNIEYNNYHIYINNELYK